MHADKTNRTMLLLLGFLVLAAGVGGLLANFGVFSTSLKSKALFDNAISDFIGRNGKWIWPVVAIVCVLIVLACLRWILALLTSTDRAGAIAISGDKQAGRTTVTTSALTSALTRELESYRGVQSAKARLLGDDDDPDLVVAVTASDSVDLGTLHKRIEREALAHARQAVGHPELPIQLDLAVTHSTSRSRND